MRKFCILFLPAIATMAQDWTVMGQGSVRLVGSTLTFSYPLQPKQLALIARPAPPEIALLARLRFRIKTDHDTAMAVLLSEKKPGGGNYTAIVWSPANAWQQVELTPADFSVSDGPNDPVDADGKLDLDAVEGVGIADLAQFFLSQPENPDFPIVINRQTGEHRVEIDHFELLTTGASPKRAGIDAFDRGSRMVHIRGHPNETRGARKPPEDARAGNEVRPRTGQVSTAPSTPRHFRLVERQAPRL